MEPQAIVAEIKSFGLSEYAIARILRKKGKRISQSTVNRIARGEVESSSWHVVSALDELRVGLGGKPA